MGKWGSKERELGAAFMRNQNPDVAGGLLHAAPTVY